MKMKRILQFLRRPKPTKNQSDTAGWILCWIGDHDSFVNAKFYEQSLLPGRGGSYSYDTYILLLEEVKKQIANGAHKRTNREAILATARVKVLT